jgi:CDP-diacylglycerol--glycerol-3-phosphate 3-phosphatidyltransferase
MISLSRIVLLLFQLFSLDNPVLFFVLYLLSGFSDVLDGYIARKTNTESELGAKLDSIADFILFAVITISIIIWMGNKIQYFIPIIIGVAIIRIFSVIIAAIRYHTFAMLHTWGNKMNGFLLFITPLFLMMDRIEIAWIVCGISLLSALEEMIIHITSNHLDLNRKSLFMKSSIPY